MQQKVFVLLLAVQFVLINAQENAGSGVASYLMDCYNDTALPGILSANGRPPASINLLIEFIRKLEDANPTLGARQLSLQLMQRFRQDGIRRRHDDSIDTRFGIPYSASRLEAFKNRIFLRELIPNTDQTLSLGDLNDIEKCALHYMVSSTIDMTVRGDESSVCSRTSRYTSRIVRKRRDVELVNPNTDVFGVMSLSSSNSLNVSQCPIELGVAYTNYGTVKAGQVLAGITTGLNQQTLSNTAVDNRFAATLAGELTEAALYQSRETIEVGAQGGWNGTINPRYYFLQKNTLLQCTDAEIRGSLDGLYMALQMSNWTSRFADIKISQILDMYYSPYQKGVFDNYVRACKRNSLYNEMTSTDTMTNQVLYFMPVLNNFADFGSTLTNSSFETFTNAGITSFNSYLPQMSTDVTCPPDGTYTTRVAADLLVFIDTSWSYTTVQPIISYVLENIDVNKFGTRYSIFSGSTLNNLTRNNTNYLSDYHEQYNQTVHTAETNGFDYIRVFEMMETIAREKLNNNSYTGGDSTVALLVPRTGLNDAQRSYVTQRMAVINNNLPSLNFVVLGTGSQNDYSAIVSNPTQDVIILQETTNQDTLKTIGASVISRIQSVPRSVINPNCGSGFNSSSSSTFTLTQYVELEGVNYYNISTNYFYRGETTRNLKIRELSFGTIYVCISRDQSKPDNSSGTCQTVRSSEQTIDITSYCDGSSVTTCQPIYLSVTGTSSDINCRETLCRFPTDIKYTISMENVGCASGSIRYYVSSLLLIFALFTAL